MSTTRSGKSVKTSNSPRKWSDQRKAIMEVCYDKGLYLPDLDLWLDAAGPRNRCVVSHAHGDHIASHEKIVATPETARLFRHRRGDAVVETLHFGERRDFGRFALTLYPAGH